LMSRLTGEPAPEITLALPPGPGGQALPSGPGGWRVSIAHSGELAAAAAARGVAVGVDVELVRPVKRPGRLAKRLRAPGEPALDQALPMASNPVAALILMWTLKESALKATGAGIGASPASVRLARVEGTDGGWDRGTGEEFALAFMRGPGEACWETRFTLLEGYCLAVSLPAS